MNDVRYFGASIDIKALAQHSSSQVRTVLASSHDTPPDVLRLLARDKNNSVKLAAALNPYCPLEILESLSVDSDWSMRLGLANQLDVCEEILSALVTHRNPYLAAQSKYAIAAAVFERQLKEQNIVPTSGPRYKLGEILVEAKALTSDNLEIVLNLAQVNSLRLGRVLLQIELIQAPLLLKALKLQSLLRLGKIDRTDAYEMFATSN